MRREPDALAAWVDYVLVFLAAIVLGLVVSTGQCQRPAPHDGRGEEERRQLATDFAHSFRVGITSSFGSIDHDVIDSRSAGFRGGSLRAF